MEKALEVERDVQENQETRTGGLSLPKCFRYQEIPRIGVSSYKAGEDTGLTVAPISRNIGMGRDIRPRWKDSLRDAVGTLASL